MREPNFFIVGAAKAGTTSLYHYLDQHPDIYMSPMKEPCYFSDESRPENHEPSWRKHADQLVVDCRRYVNGPMTEKLSGGIVCAWDDYLRLFSGATTERAVGEASVLYLWSKTAAAGIAERVPNARIVLVLRSPVERAFSQYLHRLTDGHVTQSFQDYVRACMRHRGEGMGVHEPFLEMGCYADQVQRYLDCFPRDHIGIWFYEETRRRPQVFLREVLDFLQVDSSFTPDTSKRYNEPRVPRMLPSNKALRQVRLWQASKHLVPAPVRKVLLKAIYRPAGSVTMTGADKAMMMGFYRSDIERLAEILGRDLSAWLV